MMYVRLCRTCKKYRVIRNDNTWKDKKLLNSYKVGKLLCRCEK